MNDPINPSHYRNHPSGVECITVTEHFNFNLGNAIKYIWRHADKNGVEDLQKAKWYLDRELARLVVQPSEQPPVDPQLTELAKLPDES